MLALVVGSLLAVLALAYVLWPLMRGSADAPLAIAAPAELPPEASAIEALREIEFDQATGKISPEDYSALKASYTPRALEELRVRDADAAVGDAGATVGLAGAGAELDAAEALVARARQRATSRGGPAASSPAGAPVCAEHGPRPETDAAFCSDCGRFLGEACGSCGARVEGERARFCTECGAALAA